VRAECLHPRREDVVGAGQLRCQGRPKGLCQIGDQLPGGILLGQVGEAREEGAKLAKSNFSPLSMFRGFNIFCYFLSTIMQLNKPKKTFKSSS
jgi:hypothetical protein